MAIKVVHEKDNSIRNYAEIKCPDGLKGTLLESNLKTYKFLFEFLETKLIDKKLKNEEELEKVLNTWPTFLKRKRFVPDAKFSKLRIIEDHIACVDSMGWQLIIGHIVKI